MDNFSELIKEAIAGGDSLESAMRKAANLAAKEAGEIWVARACIRIVLSLLKVQRRSPASDLVGTGVDAN